MSKLCQSRAWLEGSTQDPCPTCGFGPCPTSFNLPVETQHGPAYGEQSDVYLANRDRAASSRGLTNLRRVAAVQSGDRLHVLWEGELL